MSSLKSAAGGAFTAVLVFCSAWGNAAVTVQSPGSGLQITVDVDAGRLVYSVSLKGKAVVEQSELGVTVGGVDLGAGATLGAAVTSTLNETYPWRGVKSQAVNHYNGAVIPVTKGSQSYSLEVRAFDEGVAFRYVVPGTGARTVGGEATSYHLPAGSKVWYQLVNGRHDYETPYNSADIGALPANANMFAVVTYELPGGGYAALTEAYLRNYCGMYFLNKGNRTLQALFPAASWSLDGAFESPWRVILAGEDLNTLVNNDVINDLNPAPAPALANADWTPSGLAVWNYLGNFNQGNSMDMQQRYCRQAGEMGIPNNTVDAGFGGSLQQLAAYCKDQGAGVRILIWRRWNSLTDQNTRRDWFKSLQQWGVAGAKIDFIEGETKDKIDFYENTIKDAAEFHVSIIFHGSNRPTGQPRTYPNYISSEGIKGLEHSRLSPDDFANCINPFTRLLAGPADYTPLSFNNAPNVGRMGKTSAAQQIGTVITYTTPLQNLSVDPAVLVTHPASKFIASIPTIWDETVVLPMSKIGDLCAMARRKGNTWFVAVYSASPAARTVTLPLDFLRSGDFDGTFVSDKMDIQTDVVLSTQQVKAGASLTLQLRPNGGWAGRFVGPGGVWARPLAPLRGNSLVLSQDGRHVSLLWQGESSAALRLLSAEGKTVWTRNLEAKGGFDFSMPASNGAYWLHAGSGETETVRRLISY
jgi:alpha-glucosidase